MSATKGTMIVEVCGAVARVTFDGVHIASTHVSCEQQSDTENLGMLIALKAILRNLREFRLEQQRQAHIMSIQGRRQRAILTSVRRIEHMLATQSEPLRIPVRAIVDFLDPVAE